LYLNTAVILKHVVGWMIKFILCRSQLWFREFDDFGTNSALCTAVCKGKSAVYGIILSKCWIRILANALNKMITVMGNVKCTLGHARCVNSVEKT
jgi:hypothetical protein